MSQTLTTQKIEERIAWEFGWKFRAEYASRVLIGECISDGIQKTKNGNQLLIHFK